MYKSKCAVFCKKYFLNITQNPVFIRVYRSWCYYTSFIDSTNYSCCFHICKNLLALQICTVSICKTRRFILVLFKYIVSYYYTHDVLTIRKHLLFSSNSNVTVDTHNTPHVHPDVELSCQVQNV